MIISNETLNSDFLKRYDCVMTLGLYAKHIKSNVCLNPFLDMDTDFYIRYEVGTEEGVSALFLYEFCDNKQLKSYINDLDYGYLTSETNIAEEEMLHLKMIVKRAKKPLLLVGSDFYTHQRKDNILSMISYLGDSRFDIAFVSLDSKSICEIPLYHNLPKPINELPENNGCIVYVDYDMTKPPILKISSEFAKVWKLEDNDNIQIVLDGTTINASCRLDSEFGGIIGIVNANLDVGYRYKKVVIKKR